MEHDERGVKGLEGSIKHHEENVTKLHTFIGRFSVETQCFVIGTEVISFGSDACPLCEKFGGPSDSTCPSCPLSKAGHNCNSGGSFWHKLQESDSKEGAIRAEENMIKIMKEVLGKYTSKFKVGEEVVVSQHSVIDERYDSRCIFVQNMEQYKGKKTRVTRVWKYGDFWRYNLDIDGGSWNWTDSMLEKVKVTKFQVGARVVVVHAGNGIGPGGKGRTTVITAVGGDYKGKGDGVKVRDFKNPSYGDWIGEVSFERVEVAKYIEMKERIENVKTLEEMYDITHEIYEELDHSEYPYPSIDVAIRDQNMLAVNEVRIRTDFNNSKVVKTFSFRGRSSKIAAIKEALMWLLDHSKIKEDIVGTERDVEIEGKKYRAKILREDI